MIDRLLRKENRMDEDGSRHVRIVYTGSDAFAFSSLHYHVGSVSSYHEMWHDQSDRCSFGHGHEYLLCRRLGGNMHAKAKLGNLFHMMALPSLYSHLEGMP